MSAPSSQPPNGPGALRAQAAAWIVARDRGFTETEALEFERWLAADPQHVSAIDQASGMWKALNGIPARIGRPIVERSSRRAWRLWPAFAGAAAAALAVIGWGEWSGRASRTLEYESRPRTVTARIEPHTELLPDGSRVRLNRGAEIVANLSAHARRVKLVRGEAYFIVAPDAARPFIVHAGDVTVRAVGTAFNVRCQPRVVDVLVTEGKVEVTPPALIPTAGSLSPKPPLVVAGQRATVDVFASAKSSGVAIADVAPADVAVALAWHEPLRNLGGVTLREFAVEFERQTGRRLVVADESLRELQIGGRFRGSDLEELLRLLAENYGISAEHMPNGAVVLRRRR